MAYCDFCKNEYHGGDFCPNCGGVYAYLNNISFVYGTDPTQATPTDIYITDKYIIAYNLAAAPYYNGNNVYGYYDLKEIHKVIYPYYTRKYKKATAIKVINRDYTDFILADLHPQNAAEIVNLLASLGVTVEDGSGVTYEDTYCQYPFVTYDTYGARICASASAFVCLNEMQYVFPPVVDYFSQYQPAASAPATEGAGETTVLSATNYGAGETTVLSATNYGAGETTVLSATNDGVGETTVLSAANDGVGETTVLSSLVNEGAGETTVLSAEPPRPAFVENTYVSMATDAPVPPSFAKPDTMSDSHTIPDVQVPVPTVVEEPVIEEPVIEEPVIEEPVIEEPVIEEPVIEEPVIEEPVIEEPVIEEPVIEEPVIEEPVIEESVIEEPVIEEPVIEEPVIEEPLTPVLEVPAAPVFEEPAAPEDDYYEVGATAVLSDLGPSPFEPKAEDTYEGNNDEEDAGATVVLSDIPQNAPPAFANPQMPPFAPHGAPANMPPQNAQPALSPKELKKLAKMEKKAEKKRRELEKKNKANGPVPAFTQNAPAGNVPPVGGQPVPPAFVQNAPAGNVPPVGGQPVPPAFAQNAPAGNVPPVASTPAAPKESDTKICPNCSTKLDAKAKFCFKCGTAQ